MAIHYPPIFINRYLSEKIESVLGDSYYSTLKFFPTTPTDIGALTELNPEAANDVFAVYDRMFKLRRKAFPHIKSEQLLYYFYKTSGDIEALIETSQIVYEILDRGDDAAQDINSWVASKASGTVDVKNPVTGVVETFNKVTFDGKDFLLPFFHSLRVYQLEESRDIIDFGTARTYAANKMIVDYDWHSASPLP